MSLLRGKSSSFHSLFIISSIFCFYGFFQFFTPFIPYVYADNSISVSTDESIILNMPGLGSTAIGSSNINVTTTCHAGYTLTFNATSSDNRLFLDGDASYASSPNSYISPSDGTTALKNAPNTWGYSISSPAPTEDSVFLPVPTNLSAPATLKTPLETASETDINDNFSIYFGVSVSNDLAMGSYLMPSGDSLTPSGFSYYAAIEPSCSAGSFLEINFDSNAGSDQVDNLPASSSVIINDGQATLPSTVPTRSGYTFTEWNTATDGTGTTFYPGDIITIGTGSGELSGLVDLYAIWTADCPDGTICYHGNHADDGAMGNQTSTAGSSVALTPSNFSRAGYGFAGWNTSPDGTGTQYGPGQTITMPSSGGLNLYAKWLEPSGTFQNWAGASSLNIGDVIALRDNRDNEVYTVAKLADGNVWITENLRLNPGTATINGYNTNHPTPDFLSAAPSSSSTTSQCSSNNTDCDDRIYYYTGNMNRSANPSPTGNTTANAWYSYGTMYNWFTATAGNGTYGKSSGDITGDLCPSGWRLPNGGTTGEYNNLTATLGGTGSAGATALRTYPNNFIYSGDYNPQNNYPDGRGTQGRFWHGTAANSNNAYRMGYNATTVTPINTYYKWDNFAIRCLYQGGNVHLANVDVTFAGDGITSLTFTNSGFPTETATPSDPTVSLAENEAYTVTATLANGYEVASWATTTGGSFSDTSSDPALNPNTFTATDDTTITATGQAIPSYTVTVTLGEHVTGISFMHPDYGTTTITPASESCTDNQDGTYTCTTDLKRNLQYTLSSSYDSGYSLDEWIAGTNSTIGSSTSATTTYTITGNTTLSATAMEVTELTYNLVYSSGAGTDAPDSVTETSYSNTHSFTITNSAPIYYGYTLSGWSETDGSSTASYTAGDTITVTSTGTTTTKTLYPVYTAVATCPADKICYYDNGADINGGGRGTMANQSASSNSSATLIPSNYSKSGYGFAGWTTDANVTPYGPNATITTPTISSTGLSLYAKWIKSEGSLQDWRGCNAMTANNAIALTDTRDNNTYTVAKLADGNCWITENLRLDPGLATITTQNTHNPTQSFITESISKDESGNPVSMSTNTMCKANDDATCINSIQYNTNSLNRSLTPSYNAAADNVGWYSYGVYYNWYTATAGQGTYSMAANTNVNGDICPKNWHIPTGNSTGEYNALNTAINNGATNSDASWRSYPNNFIWSGDYNNNKRTSGYSNGRIWTATTKDNPTAYRIGIATNTVTSATNAFNKWDGFIVRCIRDEITAEYSEVNVILPAGVTSVTFTNSKYGTETATAQNGTVSLAEDAVYTITANLSMGYEFDEWTVGQDSTIGSTTQNPTTLVIAGDTTLTLSSIQIPTHTVTVNLDAHSHSVGFYNADYGTQQVVNTNNNGDGTHTETVTMYQGKTYTISSSFDTDYVINQWSTTTGGTIGNASIAATTYTITNATTLSLTSQIWAPHSEITDPGYIGYYANASDAVGTMGRQSAADGNTVKLFASNFSRDGYGFAGWSDAFDYATNANAHFYGPNEDITVPTGTTANGLSLYAVWVKSAGSMQSDAASVCNGLTAATYSNEGDADEATWSINATLSSISALTDNRDGQTYAIAKLADNKCWMIENLRLADTHQEGANTVPTTLTTANTNNPLNDNDATNPTVTLKLNYNDTTTATHLSPTSNVAYNADTAPEGWCTTNSAACGNQSRLRADNTANRATYTTTTNMTNTNANLYSYGNYYNWYSATAGRGTYSTGANVTTAGDLCPTGWHLPTGHSTSAAASGEFGLLSNSLGGYKNASDVAQTMYSSTTPTAAIMAKRLRHFPNNFLHSGNVGGASLSNRGSYGDYWSSTALGSSNAYSLYFGSSYVNPGTGSSGKYGGRAVRCVANHPSVTVSLDPHISSVTFTSGTDVQTATSSSPIVSLAQGKEYNITATTTTGYEFSNWSTTANGTLGSTTTNPTTYTVTDAATLTVTSQAIPTHTVTVNLDAHTHSVGFYNADYGTQQVVNTNNNGDGTHTETVTMYQGKTYTISSSFDTDYMINQWSTTTGGTIGNASIAATTYTVTNATTLSLTSQIWAPHSEITDPGYIGYYANASDAIGTMGRQEATDGNTVKLFASNFSRDGYGFAGWSDAFDYATNANAHFYGPNEDITVPTGTTANGLSLYAVWIKSAGDMQDTAKTASVCNGLTAATVGGARTLNSVSALTDNRDGQTYAIAKLADNKCWMIENLRLADTHQEGSNTVPTTLTTTNTNNPLNDGNATNPTVTLKHNYADTDTHTNLSATSSVAYNADTAPSGWCTTDSATCDDQSRLRTDNTANRVSYAMTDTMSVDANLYSYGNYYNWYSATAGRGVFNSGSNVNTAGDLCPNGWRVPRGANKANESNNEFWPLVVTALNNGVNPANYDSGPSQPYYDGSTEAGPVDRAIRTWPNNFLHSGSVSGGSVVTGGSIMFRGYYGIYWSSTADSNYGSAYQFYFRSLNVSPGTLVYRKYSGRTVRCLVSPGT